MMIHADGVDDVARRLAAARGKKELAVGGGSYRGYRRDRAAAVD